MIYSEETCQTFNLSHHKCQKCCYKWLNHKKNDRKWSNFDWRKCQQNAERRKFYKNINRCENSLNTSRTAPRPLRANPKTVLNSWDDADHDYVVGYLTSGCSQLGLGDHVYFSLDLGEIVPKFTLNFYSLKSINVINILYCVWNSNYCQLYL